MSALGFCKNVGCMGDLCVARGTVCCGKCGTPHPEHPVAREFGTAGKAPPKPVTVKHTLADNAAYQTDAAKFGVRIAALENKLERLAMSVQRLLMAADQAEAKLIEAKLAELSRLPVEAVASTGRRGKNSRHEEG